MTSSSRRILPAVHLDERTYKLGLPNGGNLDESDPEVRLRNIELQHLAEIEALKAQSDAEKTATLSRGREEGIRQARAEAEQRLATEQVRWVGLLHQLAAARREAFAVSEAQLVDLVLAAVDKIIACRPERPEMIAETLREAFNLLATKDELTIICSPTDASFIKHLLAEHRSDFDDVAKFVIRDDPAIQSGGCLVETVWGTIDARVEKRLAVLKQIWGEATSRPRGDGENE